MLLRRSVGRLQLIHVHPCQSAVLDGDSVSECKRKTTNAIAIISACDPGCVSLQCSGPSDSVGGTSSNGVTLAAAAVSKSDAEFASRKQNCRCAREDRLADACGDSGEADVGCFGVVEQAFDSEGSESWHQRVWRDWNVLDQNGCGSL